MLNHYTQSNYNLAWKGSLLYKMILEATTAIDKELSLHASSKARCVSKSA